MPTRMELERRNDRTIASPAGAAPDRWAPWVELSLLVRIEAEEVRETHWLHWAVPLAGARSDALRSFDPTLRAAAPGPPPGLAPAQLADELSTAFLSFALGALPRVLHRHRRLGIVSRPGEHCDAFRRRIMGAISPLLRSGALGGEDRALLAGELAAGIETVPLDEGQVAVDRAYLGVGWYPEGVKPRSVRGDERG
jgi:hypothetical protein